MPETGVWCFYTFFKVFWPKPRLWRLFGVFEINIGSQKPRFFGKNLCQ